MGWFGFFWMMLLLGLGCFMILLVLLQRGRGGGLVGALGGAGGQSAFGTRAGDVFTKITIVVATFWVATAGVGGIVLRGAATAASSGLPEDVETAVPGAPGDIGTLGGPVDSTPEMEVADDDDATNTDPEADTTEGATTEPDAKPADDALKAPELKDPEAGDAAATDAEPTEEPATE